MCPTRLRGYGETAQPHYSIPTIARLSSIIRCIRILNSVLVISCRGAVLSDLGCVAGGSYQKFGRRRIAYALAFTGVVLCWANRVRIVLAAPHWTLSVAERAYYAFDTRADALFLGCLLGLIATGDHLEGWKPTTKRTVSVAALLSAIIMIWILFTVNVESLSLPLLWIPVSEIASLIIITYFIVQPTGLGTRAIGVYALVLIGNMTYTIYLVHWPVFVAISPSTVGWPFWLIEVVRIAIVVPIVVASWYLVEKPLMQWRRKLDPS